MEDKVFSLMNNKNFDKMFGSKKEVVINPGQNPVSKEDAELLEFLQDSTPNIYVIGSGGSGCNTIDRMSQIGVSGATLVAMNTDAQHLLKVRAYRKLLLGRMKTKGMGAGSDPVVGEAAAQESEQKIKDLLSDADLVFVTCGMGGGTGTGSASVIAKAAKENGALVIGVVTLPFSSEGAKRMRNAMEGVEKLKREADTTIVVPNDKLLYFVADLPLDEAFKASDSVLTDAVKGIAELITMPGLINLDFADMRTILKESGTAMIGLGEANTIDQRSRVVDAAEKALSSPLLDLDLTQANKALVNITGGRDMTLGEAEAAVQAISSSMAKDSHVIWGARIDETLEDNKVRVLAVVTGLKEAKPHDDVDIDLDFIS